MSIYNRLKDVLNNIKKKSVGDLSTIFSKTLVA